MVLEKKQLQIRISPETRVRTKSYFSDFRVYQDLRHYFTSEWFAVQLPAELQARMRSTRDYGFLTFEWRMTVVWSRWF